MSSNHCKGTYGENELLHGNFDLDPLFIAERRPDEMRLGNGRLVRVENDLRLFVIDMQPPKKKDEPGESGVT